jgi:hypothetical protein
MNGCGLFSSSLFSAVGEASHCMFVLPEVGISVLLPVTGPVLDQLEPDASLVLRREVDPRVLEVVLAEVVRHSKFVKSLPQMSSQRKALANGI